MKEFGEYLRNERLAHGITLEEIERRTRIRRQHLIAIESGEFSRLPEPAYVKAFLKHYAHCVGLDAKAVLEQYEQLHGASAAHEVAATKIEGRSERRIRQLRARRRRRIVQWVGVISVVLIAAGVYFSNQFLGRSGSESESASVNLQLDTTPLSPTPSQSGTETVSGAAQSVEQAQPLEESATEPIGLTSNSAGQPPAEAITGDSSASTGAMGLVNQVNLNADPVLVPAVTDGSGFTLGLTAQQTSWAELHIDGARVLYRNLEPGESILFQVASEANLRLGRASDVSLSLNGNDLGPIGSGVVSKRFILEGL